MGNVEKIKSPKNTVDFNKPVMGYDGTPEPESNLGKVVAPIIGSNTQGDAWKFGSWAMDVYQGKVLELDDSDFKALKEWLKTAQVVAMIRMQVLQVLDGVR